MTAEGRGQLRAEELDSKAKEVKWRKDLPDRLTPEERSELDELRARYPRPPNDLETFWGTVQTGESFFALNPGGLGKK